MTQAEAQDAEAIFRPPTGRNRPGCGRWKPRASRCRAMRNGLRIRTAPPSSAAERSRWTGPRRTRMALQLQSMRLREFSQANATQPPVLICAPYALHGALIADFAPGHSLVGVAAERRHRPDLSHRLALGHAGHALSCRSTIISPISTSPIDEIGAPVDLVGLCQGGWLSLVYAARFPGKVRRLVLAGAPVDISTPSELSRMVAAIPQAAFEQMVRQGDGLVSGEHMLRLWNMPFSRDDVEAVLQRNSRRWIGRGRRCCWIVSSAGIARTLDLPGTYYLDVTERIFRQNLIANGSFVALGRRIDLAEVRRAGLPAGGRGRHRRPARSGVRHRAAVGHAAGVRWSGPASRAAISAFSWGAAR